MTCVGLHHLCIGFLNVDFFRSRRKRERRVEGEERGRKGRKEGGRGRREKEGGREREGGRKRGIKGQSFA